MTLPLSGTFAGLGLSFQLQDIAVAAQVAAFFDQYCIYAVLFRAYLDSNATVTNTYLTSGRIATAIDFDSAANPANMAALQSYNNVMEDTLSAGNSYERFVKPCVNSVMQAGSGTGYGVGRYWLDSINLSVPHYGVKVGVIGYPGTVNGNMIITTTYIVGFRNSL
jgi:hypothetical protein